MLSEGTQVPANLPQDLGQLADQQERPEALGPPAQGRPNRDIEPDDEVGGLEERLGPANVPALGNPSRLFEDGRDSADFLFERPDRPSPVGERNGVELMDRKPQAVTQLRGEC